MVEIVKALEEADILVKGVSETLQNDAQKGGVLPILPMLLGTLGSSLIGNILSGRGLYRTGSGNKCNCETKQGNVLYRAGQGIIKKALMPPHPLTNIEIQNYYKNEPRFNGVYCRDICVYIYVYSLILKNMKVFTLIVLV